MQSVSVSSACVGVEQGRPEGKFVQFLRRHSEKPKYVLQWLRRGFCPRKSRQATPPVSRLHLPFSVGSREHGQLARKSIVCFVERKNLSTNSVSYDRRVSPWCLRVCIFTVGSASTSAVLLLLLLTVACSVVDKYRVPPLCCVVCH